MYQCPNFSQEAVTYDRNYLCSSFSTERQIYIYNLNTGEVEEIYKPDIPEDETVSIYGLSKEYYAIRRESGVIEIYKGKSKEPCFSTTRSLSGRESFSVCHNDTVFAISYLDGTIDFYRFGDTIELIKTVSNPHASSNCEIEQFEYYADQNMYIININLKSLALTKDFQIKTFLDTNAYYFPGHDCFMYYDSSADALYTMKHYSYEDLIAESDKRLGDYLPPKRILEQYGIIE